jgi:hypothetical protein
MSLDFITADPSTAAYQDGTNFQDQQRTVREKRGVDAAVRAGVSDMLSGQPAQAPAPAAPVPGTLNAIEATPAAPVRPAPAPATTAPVDSALGLPAGGSGAAPVQLNPAPAAPTGLAAVTALPTAAPTATPPDVSYSPGGAPPGVKPPPALSAKYGDTVVQYESNGNPTASNPRSSAQGLGQFVNGTWLSLIKKHRPDVAAGRSDQQILALRGDAALSRQMIDAYAQDNAQALSAAGFPATDGNLYLAHGFGPAGAVSILKADPNTPIATIVGAKVMAANPNLFGKTAGQVAANYTRYMGGGNSFAAPGGAAPAAGQAQAVPGISPEDTAAAASGVSLGLGGTAPLPGQQGGSRYDPILQRLAETPGGGAAALGLLQQQTKADQLTANRQTQYQRLAMQALGKGDTDVFKYYAGLGGINVPPAILQNAGMAKRLATISLVAERFYKDDPAGAQRLTSAYLGSGNIDQAFQQAGPPATQPHLSLAWVRQGEQDVAMSFNTRTGQMAPVTTAGTPAAAGPISANPAAPAAPGAPAAAPAPGTPVTRDVKPTAAAAGKTQWVTSPDGRSQTLYHIHADGSPATPVTGPDNQPLTQGMKIGAVGSGKIADRETKLRMLRTAGVGEQEANMIAAGNVPSPNTVATTYSKIRGDLERNALTDADKAGVGTRANQTMTEMFGDGWQRILQGRGGITPAAPPAAPTVTTTVPNPVAPPPAAPPAAAPAAPPAGQAVRPASVPPGSLWSPSRRQFRDPQGNLYDEAGNRVGT